MATHTSLRGLFNDIANKIRVKTGGTGQIVADDFPDEIDSIISVIDVSTAAEMESKKSAENVGSFFHYIGTSTPEYVNGRYYKLTGSGKEVIVDLSKIGSYYQWQTSEISVTGIDPSYQHGVWESTGQGTANAKCVCTLRISGFSDQFVLWINSYAESNYDFTIASKLDAQGVPDTQSSTYKKESTYGYQRNPRTGLNTTYWKKVVYTSADGLDSGEHFLYIVYRKDGSVNANDDRGYFVYENDGAYLFTEYLTPNGTESITTNGTYDVKEKASVSVNVSGIIPTGSIPITSNGTYDVTQYASAVVDVSGGISGHKIYYYHGGNADGGYISINGGTAFALSQDMPDASGFTNTSSIICEFVERFKIWGFDHAGSSVSSASSWARYRSHNSGGAWTFINLTRDEASATEITLLEDIDLEIYEGTCLCKGTMISMADGTKKPVEEIDVGDFVKGYDGKSLKVRRSQKGCHQYCDDRDVWRFECGHEIITTYRHRFYNIENQKMMYLNEWSIGDHAYVEDGSKVALLDHIHEDIPCMHFSLWCEEENYFAGGLLAGNRYTPEITIK